MYTDAAGTSQSRFVLAIVCMISAGFLLSVMDGMGKELATTLNVPQAVWARYAGQTLFITLFLYRRSRLGFLKTRRPWTQIARAGALFATTLAMYTSLTLVSLAEATAIQFLAPVLVTVWAALFLGEKVGPHRILAVVFGFVGVVIIMSPGIRIFNPGLLLPLLVALCLSVYLTLTRTLSDPYEHDCTQFSTTAIGTLVLTLALPFFWQTPNAVEIVLMIAIGALGSVGHYLMVTAFSMEKASLLAPFLYSQVLGAALVSVAWFGDPLHASMMAGTAMLIGSGIYLWWR